MPVFDSQVSLLAAAVSLVISDVDGTWEKDEALRGTMSELRSTSASADD